MKRFMKYLKPVLTTFLVLPGLTLLSQEAAAVAPEIDRPIYEELGMSPTALASIMVIFTAILVGFVISLSSSAKNILEFKRSKIKGGMKTILLLFGISMSSELFAATETGSTDYLVSFPDSAFWTFFALDVVLIMIILYLTGIMRGVLSEYKVPAKINLFAKWNKQLTDVVPIEEEGSILLDHDYDGIKELDNNLPPWWKYGFYVTIVWSVFYLFYYNVFNVGLLQEQEFLTEMEEGEREVAEYKRLHPVLITADNVTLLEDASSIAKGEKVYTDYCKTCHMENGRGGAGPNLTDNTWIYGGDIKAVFKTISDGTSNGMAKWSDIIKADEIQSVASYILQLDYVAPPDGIAAQGKIIVE
jgi:cytochrome c oxidase cbb3-type subunit 3